MALPIGSCLLFMGVWRLGCCACGACLSQGCGGLRGGGLGSVPSAFFKNVCREGKNFFQEGKKRHALRMVSGSEGRLSRRRRSLWLPLPPPASSACKSTGFFLQRRIFSSILSVPAVSGGRFFPDVPASVLGPRFQTGCGSG